MPSRDAKTTNAAPIPRQRRTPDGALIVPRIAPGEIRRRRRELCLMHDFFMQVCFQSSTKCIQLILRIILGMRLKVTKVILQAPLKNLQGRSAVLDVLARDSENRRYNLEFQISLAEADPQRLRYYLSLMDGSLLRPGEPFRRLPEIFSIFLVMGDPFGQGKPIYIFTRRTEDGLPLGDGTTAVYVDVTHQDTSTLLGRLTHDLCCINPDDMYFPELRKVTRYFKHNPQGVRRMGSMMEALRLAGQAEGLKQGELRGLRRGLKQGRKEGRKEGLKEGRKEGLKEGLKEGQSENQRSTASRMLAAGKLNLEEIAEYVGLSLAEVNALAKQMRGA